MLRKNMFFCWLVILLMGYCLLSYSETTAETIRIDFPDIGISVFFPKTNHTLYHDMPYNSPELIQAGSSPKHMNQLLDENGLFCVSYSSDYSSMFSMQISNAEGFEISSLSATERTLFAEELVQSMEQSGLIVNDYEYCDYSGSTYLRFHLIEGATHALHCVMVLNDHLFLCQYQSEGVLDSSDEKVMDKYMQSITPLVLSESTAMVSSWTYVDPRGIASIGLPEDWIEKGLYSKNDNGTTTRFIAQDNSSQSMYYDSYDIFDSLDEGMVEMLEKIGYTRENIDEFLGESYLAEYFNVDVTNISKTQYGDQPFFMILDKTAIGEPYTVLVALHNGYQVVLTLSGQPGQGYFSVYEPILASLKFLK